MVVIGIETNKFNKLISSKAAKTKNIYLKFETIKFKINPKELNLFLETQNPEFIEWKWINFKLLPNIIVDFKKNVYDSLTYEIEKFIN